MSEVLRQERFHTVVDVTAKIGYEYYPYFEGEGPVLTAEKVTLTSAPDEEVVYFS